jgi:hypothetical protein
MTLFGHMPPGETPSKMSMMIKAGPDDEGTTDESGDDDDLERGRRLGGGFRGSIKVASTSHNDEEVKSGQPLSESAQAMMVQLSSTRAANSGDVMDNQAAFKTDGLLMLESINQQGDPTTEKFDDEETIKKIALERVRMKEEADNIRAQFSDQELFRLREEFNNVDSE